MNILHGLVLGIIQGLTEFLPVSSSGHLVIIQSLFKNFSQQGISFDIFLHFGTLFSVIIYFRNDIYKIISLKNNKMIFLIILGSIPAGIVGIFFKEKIENIFCNVKLVGLSLFATSCLLFLSDKIEKTYKSEDKITFYDAIIIGIFQALAIIPGISRSGSTITGGILCKLKREVAVKFSFLLSIPAIIGAVILSISDFQKVSSSDYTCYITGFVSALITGIISLKILSKMTEIRNLKFFGFYCIIAGIFALLL